MALMWTKFICFVIQIHLILLSIRLIDEVYAKLEQRCDILTNEIVCIFKEPNENVYDIPANNNEIFRLTVTNSTVNFENNIFCNVENLTTVEINFTDVNGMKGAIFRNFSNLIYLTLKSNKNWNSLKRNTFLGLKKLETLFIDSNNIKDVQHGCFDDLTDLQVLQLTHNNFRIVPNFIFNFNKKLTSLFISNNHIEILEEHSLKGLDNVSLLDLSNNDINSLNTNVFHNLKQLQHLYLSHNRIKSIENSFQVDNLRYLYIDHNDLELISPIFESENLSLIDLSSNKIREVEPSSFYSLGNLKTLSLKNNTITMILLFKNEKYRPKNIEVDGQVIVKYL